MEPQIDDVPQRRGDPDTEDGPVAGKFAAAVSPGDGELACVAGGQKVAVPELMRPHSPDGRLQDGDIGGVVPREAGTEERSVRLARFGREERALVDGDIILVPLTEKDRSKAEEGGDLGIAAF